MSLGNFAKYGAITVALLGIGANYANSWANPANYVPDIVPFVSHNIEQRLSEDDIAKIRGDAFADFKETLEATIDTNYDVLRSSIDDSYNSLQNGE